MNKALIEIDDCFQCHHFFVNTGKSYCKLSDKTIGNFKGSVEIRIPDWCKLLKKDDQPMYSQKLVDTFNEIQEDLNKYYEDRNKCS